MKAKGLVGRQGVQTKAASLGCVCKRSSVQVFLSITKILSEVKCKHPQRVARCPSRKSYTTKAQCFAGPGSAQKPQLGLGLVGLGLAITCSQALVDSLGWAGLGSGLSPGFIMCELPSVGDMEDVDMDVDVDMSVDVDVSVDVDMSVDVDVVNRVRVESGLAW